MRKANSAYSGARNRVLSFAFAGLLTLTVFFWGFSAQAQTPADDQYGSPTEIGVPAGPGTGVAADSGNGAGGGGEVGSFSTGTGEVVESNNVDDTQSVLDSVLPSTGGSSGTLVGLVALALIGTGVLVFRRRSARG